MKPGRHTYTIDGTDYKFCADRQCLVRADIIAAESLAKALTAEERDRQYAPMDMEEMASTARTVPPQIEREQEAAALATDETEGKPAPGPEPVDSEQRINDLIWELEFLGDGSIDTKVRIEALRYTLSMVKAQDLGCHFLNFVEKTGAIA